MGEGEKKEDKKKEGEDSDERMDQGVELVDGQDKDAAGGEDKDGGPGTLPERWDRGAWCFFRVLVLPLSGTEALVGRFLL